MNNKNYLVVSLLEDNKHKDFKKRWVSTDAWRGYYNITATKKSGWEEISSDWITGDWDDAGEHGSTAVETKIDLLAEEVGFETKIDLLAGEVALQGKELAVVFAETSNVFFSSYSVFIRNKKDNKNYD